MNQKIYALLTAVIFFVVTIVHLTMLIQKQTVIVYGQRTPLLSNLVILLVSGFFSYQGFRLAKKS
jgi:hypothetical protein